MYNNYDYPMGADNPSAPWNQVDPPEREFDIYISQSLSKDTTASTDQYTIISSGRGEDGYPEEEIETSDVDWTEAYNQEHYTPLQLIEKFKEFLEARLREIKVSHEQHRDSAKPRRCIKEYKHLIEECSGWVEDELTIDKQ